MRVGDESRAPHRSAFEAVVQREGGAERARESRVTVLRLLREELAPIPEQMMRRQGRAFPPAPYDVLSDGQWRTLSSSGELRAISDVALRVTITKTYELIGQEGDLEQRWRDVPGNSRVAGQDVEPATSRTSSSRSTGTRGAAHARPVKRSTLHS